MSKFGLIGAGYWGKNILRNLHSLGALHSVCDSNVSLLNEYKEKYPEVHYTDSVLDLISNSDIKAVLIATPATTHFSLAKQALLSGKDVFVEKPLSLAVQDGEELIKLANANKRVLMVGHILQYHPAVIKLKEMISNGDLGKIRYLYSNRLNIGKLRTEENILWSFAPHDISVMLSLLDEEPTSVISSGGDYLNSGVNDVTLTSLEFKNGVKGHIFVSWLHPYKEQKLIVVGSKSMAVFDDTSKEKLFLYPHKIEWKNGKIPIAQKADFQVIPIAQGEPLLLELQHFIDCVRNRSTPKTDGREGLRVLRVLELAESQVEDGVSASLPKKNFSIHQTSILDDGAQVGEGTQIWHFSHILKGSKIGKGCRIGQNVVIGPNVSIGNNCKIQNNISIYEGVTLEDAVFCGPSCVFTNVFNPRSEVPRMKELKTTVVKRGATIGANATVVCGYNLGRYSFVGAGSVVTKDVPDYALVYGNPAKIQGWICECGIKLNFRKNKATCASCGKKYIFNKKVTIPAKGG